ncbi:MAG: hypothetical protein M2R45_01631 [Verrucomicrobia subdivision 3 bacterium]|nr:hypothetical protein [Limisphaerales bacterium]MCS1412782.1 hypothetical protein [Limisphaerales bacterium]
MLNAESGDPIYQHVDFFREQGVFAEVQECFWKLEPPISGVRRQVFSPRVFLVPIFISEGYFTQQVIPRELGFCQNGDESFQRVREWGGQVVRYCNPVGTHLSMTEVLANRATSILDDHPFPSRPQDANTSLFVAGHGTGNNENSRAIIEKQVQQLQSTGRYRDVHAIFMGEEPRIGDCYALAQSKHVVVVPFFISDGLHSFEDIPVLLGEPGRVVAQRLQDGKPTWRNPTERHGKLVWYAKSIGLDPRIPDVIMERVRESVAWGGAERLVIGQSSS